MPSRLENDEDGIVIITLIVSVIFEIKNNNILLNKYMIMPK